VHLLLRKLHARIVLAINIVVAEIFSAPPLTFLVHIVSVFWVSAAVAKAKTNPPRPILQGPHRAPSAATIPYTMLYTMPPTAGRTDAMNGTVSSADSTTTTNRGAIYAREHYVVWSVHTRHMAYRVLPCRADPNGMSIGPRNQRLDHQGLAQLG
jgi:hypothetical protein